METMTIERTNKKTGEVTKTEYTPVNQRILEFRTNEKYAGWSLISEIVSVNAESVLFKASVFDANGVLKATGYAQEDKASSLINQTSYIENAETSAWGRALGNMGIFVEQAICSKEEVDMAVAKQNKYQKEEVASVTLDFAKKRTTSKGIAFNDLKDNQLEWFIKEGKNEVSKKCAELILADRKKELEDIAKKNEDLVLVDGDLPF